MPGYTLTGGFTLNNFSLNTVWTPANLFKDGSNGVWYDPSDLSTLFQNAAGGAQSPVTNVEQSVGLMLDKSKGLSLGPELVDTANIATTWVAVIGTPTISQDGDAVKIVGSGANEIAQVPLNASNGTTINLSTTTFYLISYEVKVSSGASVQTVFTNTTIAPTSVTNTSTAYIQRTQYVVPSNTGIALRVGALDAAEEIWVRNISVRELFGNHAYQTSSTARPILAARVNLLTKTEEFNDIAWTKGNANVATNTEIAPNGTLTADVITGTSTNGNIFQLVTLSDNIIYTAAIYIKKITGKDWCFLRIRDKANNLYHVWLNLATGDLGTTDGSPIAASRDIIGSGWYRLTITFSSNVGITAPYIYVTSAVADGSVNSALSTTDEIALWGADLRATNDGVGIPVYQRVNTSTDYETTGFPYYLRFDGSNDNMLTSSINFSTGTSDGQARRNLLNFPTIFNDTTWVTSTATIVPNVIESPNLTLTADKLIAAVGAGSSTTHNVTQSVTLTASTNYTYSAYLKQAELGFAILYVGSVGVGNYINLTNGTVGSTFVGAPLSTTITDVGNGWYRVSISFNSAGITSADVRIYAANADSTGSTFIGDGVSGIYIYGAQLETGLTATTFQNIGTAIMNVFTGVRKLSDTNSSGFGVITEFSANVDSNDGSFGLYAPRTNQIANSLQVTSKGATASVINYDNFTTPSTGVLTMQTNMSSDSLTLSFNNNIVGTSNSDQGIDNYGNYPLYLGSRNTSSAFFNGRLYGLVIAGKYLSFNETYLATRYMNNQTKAY